MNGLGGLQRRGSQEWGVGRLSRASSCYFLLSFCTASEAKQPTYSFRCETNVLAQRHRFDSQAFCVGFGVFMGYPPMTLTGWRIRTGKSDHPPPAPRASIQPAQRPASTRERRVRPPTLRRALGVLVWNA